MYIDEETEAHKTQVTCTRSYTEILAKELSHIDHLMLGRQINMKILLDVGYLLMNRELYLGNS